MILWINCPFSRQSESDGSLYLFYGNKEIIQANFVGRKKSRRSNVSP
jgi:hypothetical protein